jgi:hypothetical protein
MGRLPPERHLGPQARTNGRPFHCVATEPGQVHRTHAHRADEQGSSTRNRTSDHASSISVGKPKPSSGCSDPASRHRPGLLRLVRRDHSAARLLVAVGDNRQPIRSDAVAHRC